MTDMDGSELGRQIMADPLLKSTLMIMVTSNGQRGDAAALEEIGFVGYLPKPVNKAQLHKCIVLALARANGDMPETGIITRYTVAEVVKSGSGIRALLADDNTVNQTVAQAMLRKLGYTVDVVANGLEALRALELINYDLVLMDCQMPEMDGYEATRIIRNATSRVLNHGVPVIALTANAITGDREKCLAAGMTDYLPKPISLEALRAKIEVISNRLKTKADVDVVAPVSTSGMASASDDQAMADLPVLDTTSALEMCDGDASILLLMLPAVRKQLMSDRPEISSAVTLNDHGKLKKVTHRLKGSVGQIGAVRSQCLCALLERAAANADSGTYLDLQDNLFAELDALALAIDAYLAKPTTESA